MRRPKWWWAQLRRKRRPDQTKRTTIFERYWDIPRISAQPGVVFLEPQKNPALFAYRIRRLPRREFISDREITPGLYEYVAGTTHAEVGSYTSVTFLVTTADCVDSALLRTILDFIRTASPEDLRIVLPPLPPKKARTWEPMPWEVEEGRLDWGDEWTPPDWPEEYDAQKAAPPPAKMPDAKLPELPSWPKLAQASEPRPARLAQLPLRLDAVAQPEASALPVQQPREPRALPALPFVRVDVELARLAVAAGRVLPFRIWAVAHQLAQQINRNPGWIDRLTLKKELLRLGIVGSNRMITHLLKRYAGMFWTFDPETGRLYLTGAERLTTRLGRTFPRELREDMIDTNKPGTFKTYVDMSGALADVEARLYNAWFAVKSEKYGFVEIGREALEILWQRCANTLRDWEARAGIKKRVRYAETYETHHDLVPSYAYLCRDTAGETFVSWRLPNRYLPQDAEIHPRKGNARKLRHAAAALLENTALQPAVKCTGRLPRLARTKRLYFYEHRGRRTTSAFKAYARHIRPRRKYEYDSHDELAHYCHTGTRRGKLIFLLMGTDMNQISRPDYAARYDPDFQRAARGWRDYQADEI